MFFNVNHFLTAQHDFYCTFILLALSLIRLSNHLHGRYSLCYFVHRHLNNAPYNKAHSVIGTPYLAIIASNDASEYPGNIWNRSAVG